MQYDVGGCVICISYKVGYLDKERSYKNSAKEVILLFDLIFPIKANKMLHKISIHIINISNFVLFSKIIFAPVLVFQFQCAF